MAVILVAFILACTVEWDKTFLAAAQPCVNESRFKEQVLYVGQQGPPYRLTCPVELVQPLSSPRLNLTWRKDCQLLLGQEGKPYLEFASLSLENQGNYTCTQQGNSTSSFTVRLIVKESQCSKAPQFKPDGGVTRLWKNVGSTAQLNCTALLLLDPNEGQCDTTLQWSKDGQPLTNHTLYTQNTSSWSPVAGQLMVNSLLVVTLREQSDFGLYSCTVRNMSSDFSLHNSDGPSHTAAVIAAIILLLSLAIAAVVYSRCHLNIKLWYRNSYGDYELNDGKLYDAYISYVNNDHDRKFVNFILKPHLENKNAYKVHLNDNEILPGSEPSAELLMNMSRSRRLIVLLTYAYLEQDWCSNNFRQGLQHLLELCPRPILIMLEGQHKRMRPEIKQQLGDHEHCLTILTWRHNSVTPSSAFWKELALAMPRRVVFHSESAGDPQTMLHDDKDPMLTLNPDYLDCRSDTDPAGDLGLRVPVYKALACKAPVLPATPITAPEPKPSDIDVSDLGLRNYGARSDFYCLVTEEDM
ncbi:single Ig IL-1-related receptor [Chelmon rostratus]|uniref:single Ig IL-1-related receptor n=1 Tax=Chelmon rostratus TaxID=109905 RepID=UPI001BEAA015|nr:single Ig IL-1-related receptor [Chelmon rostratus]